MRSLLDGGAPPSLCCDVCLRVVPDTLMYWHRQQHHPLVTMEDGDE